MVIMATTSGSARERLQRARAAALTKVGRGQPEETFVCSGCHRDMPATERSRIALGRCRACT